MTRVVNKLLVLILALALCPGAKADIAVLTPIADTRISPGEDLNWNSLDSIAVYNEPGNVQRGLFQFDLSAIPAGAKITSATLRMTERDTFYTSQGFPTYAFRVTRPWSETQATGIRATSSTLWTYSGGDYVGTTGVQDSGPYASAFDTGTAPLLYIDLTSLVQEWVDGTPNYGVLLRAPVGNHLHFYSRELGLPDSPLLTVEYNLVQLKSITVAPAPPGAVVGGAASPAGATGTAMLTGPAPAGGELVALKSSTIWPLVDIPAPIVSSVATSIAIDEGSNAGTFTIATIPVDYRLSVKVTGQAGGITKTATLNIDPTKIPVYGPAADARVQRILDQVLVTGDYEKALGLLIDLRNSDPVRGQDIYLAAADHYLFALTWVLEHPSQVLLVAGFVPVYELIKLAADIATTDQNASPSTRLSVLWGEQGVADAVRILYGDGAIHGQFPRTSGGGTPP